MKIAIMTDSNSGITAQEAQQLGVALLLMPIQIDGQMYLEGIDLFPSEFYARLAQGADVSTSQPSPADTLELWDKLLEEYDQLVYIPMSSGLSGTAATAASLACDDPYEGRVFVADNKRISAPQRQSVLDALALRERGKSGAEIKQRLEEASLHSQIYIMVDTLHYLKKGGRITPTAALLGSALNLKPILQLQAGKLDAYKKVRGTKAAKTELVHALEAKLPCLEGEGKLIVQTAYSGSDELGAEWNEFVQQAFPQFQVYSTVLPMSIACHTGPGALGVACVRELPVD